MLEKLVELLRSHRAGLEKDATIVRSTYDQVSSSLPELRKRAEAVRLELEAEKRKQAELDNEDREYLLELRGAIVEQNAQIEDFKRDNAEAEGTLERLVNKTDEFEHNIQDIKDSIRESQKICDQVKYYTKSEVMRLQGKSDGKPIWFATRRRDDCSARSLPERQD